MRDSKLTGVIMDEADLFVVDAIYRAAECRYRSSLLQRVHFLSTACSGSRSRLYHVRVALDSERGDVRSRHAFIEFRDFDDIEVHFTTYAKARCRIKNGHAKK